MISPLNVLLHIYTVLYFRIVNYDTYINIIYLTYTGLVDKINYGCINVIVCELLCHISVGNNSVTTFMTTGHIIIPIILYGVIVLWPRCI